MIEIKGKRTLTSKDRQSGETYRYIKRGKKCTFVARKEQKIEDGKEW